MTICLTPRVQGFLFIALNLADAWVTQQLLAHGGGEANMIVAAYGNDFLIKGFLAAAIAVGLIAIGKAKLLKVLNVCMMGVVLWTGGWVLTYLQSQMWHFLGCTVLGVILLFLVCYLLVVFEDWVWTRKRNRNKYSQ